MTGARRNSKAQMKIQEMAFVMVAIFIFFALVALVFFSIRLAGLKTDVETQRQELAKEIVKKVADMPEFSWSGCDGCVDLDKVFALKDMSVYSKLWDVDYIMLERIYPNRTQVECTRANYPDCSTITVVNNTKSFGTTSTAYVSICNYEPFKSEGYIKCELGRMHAAGKVIK